MTTLTQPVARISTAVRDARDMLDLRMICLRDRMHYAEAALLSIDEATASLKAITSALAECQAIAEAQEECRDQLMALQDLELEMVAAICSGVRSMTLSESHRDALAPAKECAAICDNLMAAVA